MLFFILIKYGKSRIPGVGLVKVDKISGKETGKIVLNDKGPVLILIRKTE